MAICGRSAQIGVFHGNQVLGKSVMLAIDGGAPVRESMLSYGHQYVTDDDVKAVCEVLKSDYLTCGPATQEFESKLAEIVGAKYVTAVANGTAALHVAALAAGIGPGDEVIVSPITFAASANCVLYCGAKPVFADIDPLTWNISPESIEEKIGPYTKAVVAVDFGGVPVDLDAIKEICERYSLFLIEDAAHSLGSEYRGRPVGSISDFTTFSFHPVKTVTTAEGGAVATNDPDLAKRVELFAKHGITRNKEWMNHPDEGNWYYEQLELGYNYRMSDLQAALGVSQLKRIKEFKTRRQEIVRRYNDAFSEIPEIAFQIDVDPTGTARHLYCVRFDIDSMGVDRRFIFDALRAEGIGVNVHYLPVYKLPYYQNLSYNQFACPNANAYYDQAITLPLHCCMSDNDVNDVIEAVKKVVDESRCRA